MTDRPTNKPTDQPNNRQIDRVIGEVTLPIICNPSRFDSLASLSCVPASFQVFHIINMVPNAVILSLYYMLHNTSYSHIQASIQVFFMLTWSLTPSHCHLASLLHLISNCYIVNSQSNVLMAQAIKKGINLITLVIILIIKELITCMGRLHNVINTFTHFLDINYKTIIKHFVVINSASIADHPGSPAPSPTMDQVTQIDRQINRQINR